ncbi:MAG: response regulator transcription factor [Limisphaerales bacterium]
MNDGQNNGTPKARILIVEDDTPLAMMMVHVLARLGCDVQVASTGKKGLELAQVNHFDLITLDIDLPGISGLEICRELKERHLLRNTLVVFVTGRVAEQDVQRGLETGAVDYITKPFGVEFAPRLLSHINRECRSLSNTD